MTEAFHTRATEMFQAAEFFKDSFEAFRDSAGLLCVHAGISLNDAIFFAIFRRKLRSDDHRIAVKALNECCTKKNIMGNDRQGVTHFRALIELKNSFAYDIDRIRLQEGRSAYDRLGKFFAWSYEQFGQELKA